MLYPNVDHQRFTSRSFATVSDAGAGIVSIGGPDFNTFYRDLQAKLDLPFKFVAQPRGDAMLQDKRRGRTYRARRERRVPVEDYGCVFRLPHPVVAGEVVLLLSGITTLGVLAASKAFAPESAQADNVSKLAARVGPSSHFALLVKAEHVFGQHFKSQVDWDSVVSF